MKIFYAIKDAIKDWYIFGEEHGFWFSTKYTLGIAKKGKDFWE